MQRGGGGDATVFPNSPSVVYLCTSRVHAKRVSFATPEIFFFSFFLSFKLIFLYALRLPVSFWEIKLTETRYPEACPQWQSGESKQRGASTGNNDLRDVSPPFHPPPPPPPWIKLFFVLFCFPQRFSSREVLRRRGVGAEEGWRRRKVAAVGGGGGRGQCGTPAAPGPRGERGRGGPAAAAGSLSAPATWTKGETRMNSPSLPLLSRVISSSATLSEEIYSTFSELSRCLKANSPAVGSWVELGSQFKERRRYVWTSGLLFLAPSSSVPPLPASPPRKLRSGLGVRRGGRLRAGRAFSLYFSEHMQVFLGRVRRSFHPGSGNAGWGALLGWGVLPSPCACFAFY